MVTHYQQEDKFSIGILERKSIRFLKTKVGTTNSLTRKMNSENLSVFFCCCSKRVSFIIIYKFSKVKIDKH